MRHARRSPGVPTVLRLAAAGTLVLGSIGSCELPKPQLPSIGAAGPHIAVVAVAPPAAGVGIAPPAATVDAAPPPTAVGDAASPSAHAMAPTARTAP